jgi:hypothetical protein
VFDMTVGKSKVGALIMAVGGHRAGHGAIQWRDAGTPGIWTILSKIR